MKLTSDGRRFSAGRRMGQMQLWMGRIAMGLIAMGLIAMGLMGIAPGRVAQAQGISTTTVQGTVYLANGQAGAGSVNVSWPAFTTAAGQAVTAGQMTMTIAPDGFLSVNLAPNLGATPAGLYYTAVYHMSDGTTSTEYWVVPATAQASLGQVRAQLMPAAQAVQSVSKAYVDQAISEATQSLLTGSGGTLSGPLYLSGDPTQPLQAADKHYVDSEFSQALPISGGTATGPLTAVQLGAAYQVDQFPGADFGAKLQACLNRVNATYGGTCDARNFAGTLAMASSVTISTGNTTVLLPCATIATANQVIVTAGTRNVSLRGCALRGGSAANGNQGGTVFEYSGTGAMVQVGDQAYAVDTPGFHMDNAVISTTAATSATAQGLAADRTQEMGLESLYFLGNQNQTGMTLDGTGNYTGGTFFDDTFNGFQTAVNAIGHQITNPATTDWLNASTFVRLHIDCPTSGGSPVSGTYGINLQQGDGNTFTGGDVEGCDTALHLGPNAQNNTIVGLRNENSNNQVVADAGSSYNSWMTGGTLFTGKLTDNGTRNSFLDTFHRSFNGLNGDWYGSQQDATVTNRYRLGIGTGNERGLLNRYQTDYGYRWTMGLSDATAGEQFYQIQDELNNVYRLSIGQYNHGQANTNNQTVINAAGTGAIVLNGANNAGSGGVVFGSGGPSETTVATINNAGNAQFNGSLQVGGTSTFAGSTTVRNQADAEIDAFLWAGATTNQKESFIYKDYTGASQWYMVKDANNNWALNSATGGLDSFKAYQSTNSGDTYINASNPTGVVRVNYEAGSGAGFSVYGGASSTLYASFTGAAAIKFPGLAAGSGYNCLQIDASGYLSNTGSACGSGSGGSGTVSSGNAGQIAYYAANGTSIAGMSTVPVSAGGTGAATAAGAVSNLLPGVSADGANGIGVAGSVAAAASIPAAAPYLDIRAYGAVIDGATPIDTALQNAFTAAKALNNGNGATILLPCVGTGASGGCYLQDGSLLNSVPSRDITIKLQGEMTLGSTLVTPGNTDWVCDGGGYGQQFQNGSPACTIQAPNVSGTLGTAITSTNTPVTFTPTFTYGSIANFHGDTNYGSAITIAGTTACGISSITRTTASYNNVVATLSASCRIPAGTTVTVAGVTDSSFDTTPMVTYADYPTETLTWTQSGSAATSSGGTVTGFNEDSFETVRIISVSGSTVTAVFDHTHSATDQWGMVAIAPAHNSYSDKTFEGINVVSNRGAGFWAEHDSFITLRQDGFGETANMTSIPVELDSSWWVNIQQSSLLPTLSHGCTSNCGQQGYPYGLRCTGEGTNRNPSTDYACLFTKISDNSVIGAGIKVDTGSVSGLKISPPSLVDTVIEQPINGAVTIDPRYSSAFYAPVSFRHSTMQDSFMNYPMSWVNYTDQTSGEGETEIDAVSSVLTGTVAGKYYTGRLLMNGVIQDQGYPNLPIGRGTPAGTINNGATTVTELDGIDAAMGPSLIPYATQNVTTNASSWICNGTGCAITTGVQAPDGTATAATLTTGSVASPYIAPGSINTSTSPGDWFIFGGWERFSGKPDGLFELYSYGATDTFAGAQSHSGCGASCASSGPFQTGITGMWWHPVVAAAQIATGTATAHAISFRMMGSASAGNAIQFWQPFLIYIPASAGVTADEVERWRQQLMHGVVPANMPGGGGILAMNAAHKLYWGSDTDLYRGAAGVVKTDGALNANSLADSGLTTAGIVTNTSSGVLGTTAAVSVANGGTGATTASTALTNLGAAPLASPTFTGTVTAPLISGTATVAGGTGNPLTTIDQGATGMNANLAPDSSLQLGSAYWTLAAHFSISPIGATGTNGFVVATGGSGGYYYVYSAQFDLIAGQTYTLSGYIDNTSGTGGSPGWLLYDPSVTTQYASLDQGIGQAGRVSSTFVMPAPSGYAAGQPVPVVLLFDVGGSTFTSTITAAAPMIQSGSVATGYQPNIMSNNSTTFAAPAVDVKGPLSAADLVQPAANTFAGTCAMSSSTICTATVATAYSSTPVCIATVQGATPIAAACSVSGATVTITAASSNSATWGYMLVGNPN